MSEKASDFGERLNCHPILKKWIQSLSEIIEDRAGIYNTPDNAEEKIIEEVRCLERFNNIQWADLFPSYEKGLSKILKAIDSDRKYVMIHNISPYKYRKNNENFPNRHHAAVFHAHYPIVCLRLHIGNTGVVSGRNKIKT